MGAHSTTIEPAGLAEKTGVLHPRDGDSARIEAYLPQSLRAQPRCQSGHARQW